MSGKQEDEPIITAAQWQLFIETREFTVETDCVDPFLSARWDCSQTRSRIFSSFTFLFQNLNGPFDHKQISLKLKLKINIPGMNIGDYFIIIICPSNNNVSIAVCNDNLIQKNIGLSVIKGNLTMAMNIVIMED